MDPLIIATDKPTSTASTTEQSSFKNCKTTCPYCGVGCGVNATVQNNKIIEVKGLTDHPSNLGRLCVKGSSLAETQGKSQRILAPRIDGQTATWEQATNKVADEFTQIIKKYGPDSVAFYLSGQLLTEDYYVANKLMKGFIGSGNVDTNSRLCMASASSAHKRAFGEDTVPGNYQDLENADTIFIVGSNTAYAHPIVYQRIVKAKEGNPSLKVIVIDPRESATAKEADLHLAIKPGSDAYYFNGLLMYLSQNGGIDNDYIEKHCQGFSAALATAVSQLNDIESVATACDIAVDLLEESYQLFTRNKRVVTIFSQGINQSSTGVDKGNAIINCHLASGKIGFLGAGPFSITGQPNAMGGREVGGLASQLAAHMHFESRDEIEIVKEFWQAPDIATKQGLKAVDMFNAIDSGQIKAVWIMATNPVVSMPNADFVKNALKKCSLVVVSECYENTDTLACADVVFPATTWGEKQGSVTNSERTISVQQPLLTVPGQAKNDWQIICDVAAKMGFKKAFDFGHPVEIFREHAALSGFKNLEPAKVDLNSTELNKYRVFNISALADISIEDYQNLTPIKWPIVDNATEGTERLYTNGGFATKSGKANLVPIIAQLPKKTPNQQQVIMNTGRIRDQWHTMNRTGRVPKLMTHIDEPCIDIHPSDAKRFNLQDQQLASLSNLGSTFIGRVAITEQQRLGEIFVPIHWNDNFSASARASALVNPITDDLCGQPEFKHSPVEINPFNSVWSGYLISYKSVKLPMAYWTKIQLTQGVKYVLSDSVDLPDDESALQVLFPEIDDWVVLKDENKQVLRIAGFVEEKLMCFFAASTDLTIKFSTRFIEQQLQQPQALNARFKLLSGVDSDGKNDVGAIICSCFQIGEKTISQAIKSGQCKSVEQLGEALKCGTNCGSCIPELKTLFK